MADKTYRPSVAATVAMIDACGQQSVNGALNKLRVDREIRREMAPHIESVCLELGYIKRYRGRDVSGPAGRSPLFVATAKGLAMVEQLGAPAPEVALRIARARR
jgi:hypothetical protein